MRQRICEACGETFPSESDMEVVLCRKCNAEASRILHAQPAWESKAVYEAYKDLIDDLVRKAGKE